LERAEFGVAEAVNIAVALYEARVRGTEPLLDMSLLERLGVAERVEKWTQLVEKEFE
jgi:hypothetical protein